MNPVFGKTNKKNKVSLLFIAAALIGTMDFSACSMLPQEEETLAPPLKVPEKITYETMEVKKGNIERKIRVTGRFISVAQTNAQFKERGGRLSELKVHIGQKVKKGDVLATLETQTLGDDIKLQKIALERSQLAYDKAKKLYDADGGINKYDLDMARLDVEANQIRLRALQRAFNESQLISPIDGDVIYAANLKTGDWIDTFSTIITVADPTILQLRYSEDRVGDFIKGMLVDVNVDNVTYAGEVVMTPADLPIDANESMKNTVFIGLDEMPETARIGGDAQIVAILDAKEDTVVLPKFALNKNFGRTYVNVLKNNIREERDVEVGIQSDTEVEIVKGLEIGELVIIR